MKCIPSVARFLGHVVTECQANGVSVLLPHITQVRGHAGYFDGTDLVVAMKHEDWLSVLAHEFCHANQTWENAFSQVFELEAGHTHIFLGARCIDDREALIESACCSLAIELDCEKRAVSLMDEFSLPIDLDLYIRKANAYLYSYPLIAEAGLWNERSTSSSKEILDIMPTTFGNLADYYQPPTEYVEAFVRLFPNAS